MKHLLRLIVLFGTVLSLCACSVMGAAGSFLPQSTFTAEFSATANDFLFAGTVSVSPEEGVKLTVTSPENIAGFTVTYQNGSFTYDVLGVPDHSSADEVSDSSPIKQLSECVSLAAFEPPEKLYQQKNEVYTELSACSQSFLFYWDKSGMPLKLTGSDLSVTFQAPESP